MRPPYGWNYPAGLENNPNAPWNQIDNGEDSEDDHAAMLSCRCTEADRMSFVCLKCGSVHLWDPSWFFIGGFVALFAWNLWVWL